MKLKWSIMTLLILLFKSLIYTVQKCEKWIKSKVFKFLSDIHFCVLNFLIIVKQQKQRGENTS